MMKLWVVYKASESGGGIEIVGFSIAPTDVLAVRDVAGRVPARPGDVLCWGAAAVSEVQMHSFLRGMGFLRGEG